MKTMKDVFMEELRKLKDVPIITGEIRGDAIFDMLKEASTTEAITIRKSKAFPISQALLFNDNNFISPEVKSILENMVNGRQNICISKATHTGMTTFLRSLVTEPDSSRVVVIETAKELISTRSET